MTFPPDFSFFIQIASFVVLWYGLKRLLFDPVLQVLDERKARTFGAEQEAAAATAAAEVSAADYERRMRAARAAVFAEGEVARAATQEEERRVISAAREQASAELAQLRDNLRLQAEAARPALAADARDLGARMADRVMGRPIG